MNLKKHAALMFGALLMCGLLWSDTARAQNDITLSWGNSTLTTTSTATSPYACLWSQVRHQYLITKADLNAAGLNPPGPVGFTAIYFYIASLPTSSVPVMNFTIKMKNTPLTTLTTTFENTGLQQVFGPVTYPSSAVTSTGWFKHTFTAPFMWDGVSNILLDVCHDNGNNNYNSTWNVYYGNPTGPTVRSIYQYSDTQSGLMCSTTTGYTNGTAIPNMKFEACSQNATNMSFDAPIQATVPSILPINYVISHPSISFTSQVNFQLRNPSGAAIGAPQSTGPISVTAGVPVNGTFNFNAGSVTPGFYRIDATFNALNSCGLPQQFTISRSILLLGPGMVMCTVWPGDVNQDLAVNYSDRKSLNQYIQDANLRASWLQGPARYRTDAATNPMTYLTWEAQPGVPWSTPDGCHMDVDGNGIINALDYLGIKVNWLKTHGTPAKAADSFTGTTFDLSQNYPNPFNPTTVLSYSAPEKSQVSLVVTDMLGRTVSTLVSGEVAAGVHQISFDGANLNSGTYLATITMVGSESGLTFSKIVKMTLMK